MRLVSICALALGLVFAPGCLDQLVPEHTSHAQSGTQGSQSMNDGSASADAATMDDSGTVSHDGDGGLGAFGATCATNADCQSNLCQPSNMGASLACTQACTNLGQNDPTCPGAGFCNMKGFCKT